MNFDKNNNDIGATSLDQMVANTCFCKLKSFCNDKSSNKCMQHKNHYQAFMVQKHEQDPKLNFKIIF